MATNLFLTIYNFCYSCITTYTIMLYNKIFLKEKVYVLTPLTILKKKKKENKGPHIFILHLANYVTTLLGVTILRLCWKLQDAPEIPMLPKVFTVISSSTREYSASCNPKTRNVMAVMFSESTSLGILGHP